MFKPFRELLIIYSDWLLISTPTYTNGMVVPSSVVGRQQLWLTNGNPDNAHLLESVQYSGAVVPHEWVTSSLVVKPDSSQIVYLRSTGETPWQLYSLTISQNGLKPDLQPAIQGNYGGEGVWLESSSKMIWRTSTLQIFFYSFASSTDQTFLLDIDNGHVCSLSFDGWVYFARWSPNGRYLAVITSHGPKIPIWTNYDLNVLDTLTGDLYKIDTAKIDPPNLAHLVGDLSWAPDNHHLAIIEVAYSAGTSPPPSIDRLYLVDFLSGEVSNPFPAYQFNTGWWGTGLAWSPDGSKILATCPTEKEGRLCYIPVHINGK